MKLLTNKAYRELCGQLRGHNKAASDLGVKLKTQEKDFKAKQKNLKEAYENEQDALRWLIRTIKRLPLLCLPYQLSGTEHRNDKSIFAAFFESVFLTITVLDVKYCITNKTDRDRLDTFLEHYEMLNCAKNAGKNTKTKKKKKK